MKFHHALTPMEIAEQISVLINSYNALSFQRTPVDILKGTIDYVTETHGRWLLGCCGLQKSGFHLTEIKHLAVTPTWRRRGVGRFLIKRALNLCETPLVYATIRAENRASLGLFRSLGFQESAKYHSENHDVVLVIRVSPKCQQQVVDWKRASSSAGISGREPSISG